MATYAMICNNRVIDVLHNQEVEPKWPPDPAGIPVTAVLCSDEAARDWDYNPETGEVFEPVYIEPEESEETVKEPSQLDRIEAALANLSAGGVSAADIEAAILEGVNEV